MRKLLLDTGPLVALLDRSEATHNACVAFLKTFHGQLLTTEPVITEAMYLLSDSVAFQRTCIDFLVAGQVQIVPASYANLQRVIALMETYHDIPMDFADGTLVAIAEALHLSEVFTLDRRGFATYRFRKTKPFRIYP